MPPLENWYCFAQSWIRPLSYFLTQSFIYDSISPVLNSPSSRRKKWPSIKSGEISLCTVFIFQFSWKFDQPVYIVKTYFTLWTINLVIYDKWLFVNIAELLSLLGCRSEETWESRGTDKEKAREEVRRQTHQTKWVGFDRDNFVVHQAVGLSSMPLPECTWIVCLILLVCLQFSFWRLLN